METVPEPAPGRGDVLLRVRMVGLCGSDLNSFRGLNPLVSFPRIPGHEVSATVVQGDGGSVRSAPMWRCLPTPVVASARHAAGDARMHVSSTRLWASKGTVLYRIHRDAAREIVPGQAHA